MRISDWSSDVCSSDLLVRDLQLRRVGKLRGVLPEGGELVRVLTEQREERRHIRTDEVVDRHRQEALQRAQDRQSVVSGQSVSVRVDLGGRLIYKIIIEHAYI